MLDMRYRIRYVDFNVTQQGNENMKHKFVIEIETLTSDSFENFDGPFLNILFSKFQNAICKASKDEIEGVRLKFVSIKKECQNENQ